MEFLSLSRRRSIPPRETSPAARSEEKRLFRRLPGQRTFILCSAPNLQEEFSSGQFYPITNGFTDARSIKRDHATGKVASHAGLFRGGRGRNTSSPKNACVGGYRKLDSNCFAPNWAVRDDSRDRDANSSRQNDVTWCDFLQGKQIEFPLYRSLSEENIKNLPLLLRARGKYRARLVGKSNCEHFSRTRTTAPVRRQ